MFFCTYMNITFIDTHSSLRINIMCIVGTFIFVHLRVSSWILLFFTMLFFCTVNQILLLRAGLFLLVILNFSSHLVCIQRRCFHSSPEINPSLLFFVCVYHMCRLLICCFCFLSYFVTGGSSLSDCSNECEGFPLCFAVMSNLKTYFLTVFPFVTGLF